MIDRKRMSEPTKDDLRRRIFDRLGWTIWERSVGTSDNEYWFLTNPNGKQYTLTAAASYTEQQAFAFGCQYGYIPNWPDDLNAAARDLLRNMPGYYLRYWSEAWDCIDPDFGISTTHTNPAHAICLAWLQMHEEATDATD